MWCGSQKLLMLYMVNIFVINAVINWWIFVFWLVQLMMHNCSVKCLCALEKSTAKPPRIMFKAFSIVFLEVLTYWFTQFGDLRWNTSFKKADYKHLRKLKSSLWNVNSETYYKPKNPALNLLTYAIFNIRIQFPRQIII